jgi:hypothetical protein
VTDGEGPADSAFLVHVVRELIGGRATVVQSKTQAEGSAFVNAFQSRIEHPGPRRDP